MSNVAIAKPNDVKLRIDRVGRKLNYLGEAEEGETVNFFYYGGSENAGRTVLVQRLNDEGIEGITLERNGEWRRYADDKARNIKVVSPFVMEEPINSIRFDKAFEALQSAIPTDELVKLYAKYIVGEQSGMEVAYDEQSGNLVVSKPQAKLEVNTESFRIIRGKESVTVTLYPATQRIGFIIYGVNDVVQDTIVSSDPVNLQPAIEALQKLLA